MKGFARFPNKILFDKMKLKSIVIKFTYMHALLWHCLLFANLQSWWIKLPTFKYLATRETWWHLTDITTKQQKSDSHGGWNAAQASKLGGKYKKVEFWSVYIFVACQRNICSSYSAPIITYCLRKWKCEAEMKLAEVEASLQSPIEPRTSKTNQLHRNTAIGHLHH